MSPPTPSSPSQSARNTSRSAYSNAQYPPTSTAGNPTQYSQTSTANNLSSNPWPGETQTDASQSAYWALRYPRIPEYIPPAPKSRVRRPIESLEPLTQQRKRPADSAASLEPAKISRADTRHNSPPTTTAEHYLEASIAGIFRRRRAKIRAEEEAKEEARAIAEDQQRDDEATTVDHRETPQATARSGSSAHTARVSAIGQRHAREQTRAESTRLGEEHIRPSSLYQEDIPITVPPRSICSASQFEPPSPAGQLGAEGRKWVKGKKHEAEMSKKDPGQNKYVVGE
jgi:hypothetical protein